MRLFFLLLGFGLCAVASSAGAAEAVEIPQGDVTLRGVVYRPAGSGPFPAAVALHGCESLLDRSGKIVRRYADWGDRLAAAGLAVIFPDSFGSRGLRAQCRVRERKVRTARERVADANAARQWLQSQPWAAKEHVSLVGWSDGGIAALWAVRPRVAEAGGGPDFRSAVALYPGCRKLGRTAWSARVPTLILVGRADDWTTASPCEQMVAGARGRSAKATLVVYPNAHHEFDHPDYPLRERTGLAHSADGSGRAHLGTNLAARADALKRVPEWLKR
jgi:dienelactone hydrolase